MEQKESNAISIPVVIRKNKYKASEFIKIEEVSEAEDNVKFQGYLEQRSTTIFKTYKKRWVVLDTIINKLYCYRTKEMTREPTKIIDLTQYKSIGMYDNNTFTLFHSNKDQNRTFKAANVSILNKWIDMIMPHICQAPEQISEAKSNWILVKSDGESIDNEKSYHLALYDNKNQQIPNSNGIKLTLVSNEEEKYAPNPIDINNVLRVRDEELKQICVYWSIPPKSYGNITYKIEFDDNEDCKENYNENTIRSLPFTVLFSSLPISFRVITVQDHKYESEPSDIIHIADDPGITSNASQSPPTSNSDINNGDSNLDTQNQKLQQENDRLKRLILKIRKEYEHQLQQSSMPNQTPIILDKMLVVIICVASYQKLMPLNGTKIDKIRLQTIFKDKYNYDVLANKDPTVTENHMEDILNSAKKKFRDGDYQGIIVFYSGHGSEQHLLLSNFIDNEHAQGKYLRTEFESYFNGINVKEKADAFKLYFIDACRGDADSELFITHVNVKKSNMARKGGIARQWTHPETNRCIMHSNCNTYSSYEVPFDEKTNDIAWNRLQKDTFMDNDGGDKCGIFMNAVFHAFHNNFENECKYNFADIQDDISEKVVMKDKPVPVYGDFNTKVGQEVVVCGNLRNKLKRRIMFKRCKSKTVLNNYNNIEW